MKVRTQFCTLHQGNFLIDWGKVHSESVCLAILDPPYGQTRHEWDRPVDLAVVSWILNRLLTNTGSIAIFSSAIMLNEVETDFSKYFKRRYVEIIHKPNAMVMHKDRPKPDIEFVSVFDRKRSKKIDRQYNWERVAEQGDSYVRVNKNLEHANLKRGTMKRRVDRNDTGLRYPSSVVRVPNRPAMSSEEKKSGNHSTQKSLDYMQRIVLLLSNRGDLILDCFSGSATAMLAAAQNGRSAVGFESEEKIFNKAQIRLHETIPNRVSM